MDNEVITYEEYKEEPKKESVWALRGRLRSRVLWAAVVGMIITICSAFNLWQYIGIDSATFQGIATAIGGVLTAFGILNDPTNKEGF